MREVTKDEFFAEIYTRKLDVHPHIINDFEHNGRGYIQAWKLRNGQVFGRTHTGDLVSTPHEYFLA